MRCENASLSDDRCCLNLIWESLSNPGTSPPVQSASSVVSKYRLWRTACVAPNCHGCDVTLERQATVQHHAENLHFIRYWQTDACNSYWAKVIGRQGRLVSRFVCYILSHLLTNHCLCPVFTAKLALQALYICYGISIRLSVPSSVRPLHSGIVSKWGNAKGRGLYYRVAQCL